ncbi:hypothetical protein [Marinitoga lauensis]|nr:hypothetical protein [Marinitoga lauensis]
MNIKNPVLMVLKTNIWNLKEIDLEKIKKDINEKIDKAYSSVISIFK